eukprot:ANDGO_06760.mRNA.1 hypothetical protein
MSVSLPLIAPPSPAMSPGSSQTPRTPRNPFVVRMPASSSSSPFSASAASVSTASVSSPSSSPATSPATTFTATTTNNMSQDISPKSAATLKLAELNTALQSIRSTVNVQEAKSKGQADTARFQEMRDYLESLRSDMQAERVVRVEMVTRVEDTLSKEIAAVQSRWHVELEKLKGVVSTVGQALSELHESLQSEVADRQRESAETRAEIQALLDGQRNMDVSMRSIFHDVREFRSLLEKASSDTGVVLGRVDARIGALEKESSETRRAHSAALANLDQYVAFVKAMQLDVRAEKASREDALSNHNAKVEHITGLLRDDLRKIELTRQADLVNLKAWMERTFAEQRALLDESFKDQDKKMAEEMDKIRKLLFEERAHRLKDNEDIIKHFSENLLDLQKQILGV